MLGCQGVIWLLGMVLSRLLRTLKWKAFWTDLYRFVWMEMGVMGKGVAMDWVMIGNGSISNLQTKYLYFYSTFTFTCIFYLQNLHYIVTAVPNRGKLSYRLLVINSNTLNASMP